MPLLMQQVRTILGRRCGPWVALADLADAVGWSLRAQGLAVADPTAVADADLAGLEFDRINELFDVAEWRIFESVSNNLSEDQLKSIGIIEDLDKLTLRLRRRTEAMYERVQRAYGVGLPTLQAGVADLNDNQRDIASTIDFF